MRKTLFAFLLLFGLVTYANAGLVAYDSVNAAVGNLNGVASGWNLQPWFVQNNNTTSYTVGSPGLSYQNLQVAGNRAVGGGSWLSAGELIDMPTPSDPYNEWVPWRKQDGDGLYKAGAEGTTLWASFLARHDMSNNDYAVSFAQSHIAWNPGSEGAKVGLSGGVWTLSEINGGPSTSTGVARTVGQTYLMVLEIEFVTEGSDRVTLFVNPTPGLSGPSVTGTTITTTKDFCLYNVQFYPGSGTNNGSMDELRFGSTFADVVPIPEPATIGLLGLGGLVLLRRRR
jgi:hypothetical protein